MLIKRRISILYNIFYIINQALTEAPDRNQFIRKIHQQTTHCEKCLIVIYLSN